MKILLMLLLSFSCFKNQDVVSKEPVKWKTNEKVKDLKNLLQLVVRTIFLYQLPMIFHGLRQMLLLRLLKNE